MKTAKVILIVATAILCTGCSSIMMNVLSYRDPELEYQDYVSFSTISWDEKNPLLEKELLLIMREALEERGFVYAPNNPDFVVALSHEITPIDKHRAASTIYVSQTEPASPVFLKPGEIGIISPPRTTHRPMSIPERQWTEYETFFDVFIIDRYLTESGLVNIIWSGRVISELSSPDILEVAPYMINELLNEFPDRSGKPSERRVSIK